MRNVWLVLGLLGCGKARDIDADLAKVTGEVKARFSAILAKVDAQAPDCTAAFPRETAIRILTPTLAKIAGADLPKDDPAWSFVHGSFETSIIDRYTNQFNPKSSTVKYGNEMLAVKHVIVVKIDKYVPARVSGNAFEPGTLNVRAILFDAATATPTCAKKYDVKNSDKVWASYSGTAGPSQKSVDEALLDDLQTQFSLSGPSAAFRSSDD